MQAKQREAIIDRYGLKPDAKSHVRAFCCVNCDLMQQEKEILTREKEGLVMKEPQKEEGMAYGSA
jgi:ATP-dependent RNA circularization protein (DNA/RNA ligase family)